MIDVGAQTGDGVLYFSQRGARLIYAFEPLERNFKILQNNIINNKINCYSYNTGLGNDVGIINIDSSGNRVKPVKSDLKGGLNVINNAKTIIIETHSKVL
ncbi:MAG: FkbM family methyltransferase [Thermoplasmatales archaeon]|nr:MAG: FkbM family methyltransferase [Thermoplasmatales archaeon]